MAHNEQWSLNTNYNRGCRCQSCIAAKAARARSGREAAISGLVPDHAHGTLNGYDYYNCRCDPCRRAKAVSQKGRPR